MIKNYLDFASANYPFTKICPFPGNDATLGSKPLRSFSLSGRTLTTTFILSSGVEGALSDDRITIFSKDSVSRIRLKL